MRILISGASGYVGKYVLPLLHEQGHSLTAVVRGPRSLPTYVKQFFASSPEDLQEACDQAKPEAILHMAADTNKSSHPSATESLLKANVLLPVHLAAAAVAAGCGLFCNLTTYSTASDDESYAPQTLYAATKKACEDLLVYYHQSEGLRVCNLVVYDVYGPRQPHKRFLNSLVDSVLSGTAFSMTRGEQEVCFISVRDVAAGISHCFQPGVLEFENSPLFHCLHGPEVFRLSSVPALVSENLCLKLPEIINANDYRKNEIMKFNPRWAFPPGWSPRVKFAEGILELASGIERDA